MTYIDPVRGINGYPFEKRRRGRKRDVDKLKKIRERLANTDRRATLSRLREQQKQIDAAKEKGVETFEDIYQLSPEDVFPFLEE